MSFCKWSKSDRQARTSRRKCQSSGWVSARRPRIVGVCQAFLWSLSIWKEEDFSVHHPFSSFSLLPGESAMFQTLCWLISCPRPQGAPAGDRGQRPSIQCGMGAISFEEFVEALEKVNRQAESEHPISWLKVQDQTVPCSLVSKNWTWEPSCRPALPLPYYLSKILRQPPFGVHTAFQNGMPSSFLFSIHSPVPPL